MPEPRAQEARFNRLYERHFDAVRAYAWRRAPSLADEIVAEMFLVAWRRLPEVPDDALPWLIGVTRNVRANLHRSDRRRDALVQRLGPESTAESDPLVSVDERDALRGSLMPLHPEGALEDVGGYSEDLLRSIDEMIAEAARGDGTTVRQHLRANC